MATTTMRSTTYTTTNRWQRANNAWYWVVGAVLLIAGIIFFAQGRNSVVERSITDQPAMAVPAPTADSTVDTSGVGAIDTGVEYRTPVDARPNETAPTDNGAPPPPTESTTVDPE